MSPLPSPVSSLTYLSQPIWRHDKKNGLTIEKYEVSNGFKEKSHISVLDIPNGLRIDLRGVYTEWDKGVVETAEKYDKLKLKAGSSLLMVKREPINFSPNQIRSVKLTSAR